MMLKAVGVEADTLPEAWEKAVIKTWEDGAEFPTEYDKTGDPPSKDSTAMILVRNPMQEPRIHRAFPGGLNDLWKYREEVVHGVHDHWVNPTEGKWEYTYHQRIQKFKLVRVFGQDGKEKNIEVDPIDCGTDTFRVDTVNQLEDIINKLCEAGHTRRAIVGLWRQGHDIHYADPPCLNEIQFRISEDNKLVMQILIRSNDAYKAGFMSMYAFTELQAEVAKNVSKKSGKHIQPGEYCHHAFSFHIYGSYFNEFRGFLETVRRRKTEDRVYNTNDAIVQDCFDDGRLELLDECLDDPKRILPLNHQIRIYNELPKEYQEKVNPRVREAVKNATK